MKYEVTLVPKDAIAPMWVEVANLLAPAIEQSDGRHTSETVRYALVTGASQLWLVLDVSNRIAAAITTGVVTYPAKAVLGVHFIGGDKMHEWVETLDERLRAYAADLGLQGLESVGRAGWTRILRGFGWRQTMVMMERGLEPTMKHQERDSWVKVVAAANRSPNPGSSSRTSLNTRSHTTGGLQSGRRQRA